MTPRSRNHRHGAVWTALGASIILTALSPAAAMERSAYSLEVLVNGEPLQEHAARDTTYVEAVEGREYSIRLSNRTPGRVAVALSVDGLNTIDAKVTSAREASKWILDPYQTITIDGWQTSSNTARRFYFTTEPESYGAWIGQTRNLGIISAAFYRERRPEPAPILKERGSVGAPEPKRDGARLEASPSEGREDAGRTLSDDYAATGIGEEVGHSVTRVRFDAERSPAAMVSLRYEYRDALVRLGVIPRRCGTCEDPLTRRERARGFEGMDFAPDPYRRTRP